MLGFNVYRTAEKGASVRVNRGLIPAHGGASGGHRYALPDRPGVGRFSYQLEVVNGKGAAQRFGPVSTVVAALRAFLPWGVRW